MSAEDELRDDTLSALIQALPGASGPPPGVILREARARRPRQRWIRGGVAAAAAVALVVIAPGVMEGTRARGLATADGAVRLQAAAEGAGGRRALASGATIGADEQVVFRLVTSQPGRLRLIERGGAESTLYPPPGVGWEVAVGEHFPGGDAPLAYRPDGRAPGTLAYDAEWCPADGGGACVRDHMTLSWEAPE